MYNRRWHEWADLLASFFAARVIANSEATARLVRVPWRWRVLVIPNFVDLVPDYRVPDICDEIRCAIVGRLAPVKRVDLAIRAVAALRQQGRRVRLAIYGEGGERSRLERLVDELDASAFVAFHGVTDNPIRAFQAGDVALLTSDSEGSPNAVVEALAAGRPVVATRVGGVEELVDHGVEGFLVDPGDIDSIAGALARLSEDETLRRSMGERAQGRAIARHSRASFVSEMERLYSALVGLER